MKFESIYGGRQFLTNVFHAAAEIAAGKKSWRIETRSHEGRLIDWEYKRTYEGRSWFARIYSKYNLHPVIDKVIEGMNYQPKDWQQLMFEWPHKAEGDPNRLAYTQNERKGESDIQTVTTIGKYLQRHFVMPDHVIRDVVALFVSEGDMEIRNTVEAIVESATNGPTTCMGGKRFEIRCTDGTERHPYEAYRPDLGWSVAVRIHQGRIDGRALIYTDPEQEGCDGYFVRSFKRDLCNAGGYSYTDEMLEAWLVSKGICKNSDWEGAHLAAYEVHGGYLAPYLDGGVQNARYSSLTKTLIVDSDGNYDLESTSGMTSEAGETCEDCGAHADEDDMYWVGRGEDQRVCSGCIDSYTYVYGRRGNQYYIGNDYAIEVSGDWYDEDYLGDNDIVELHDGDYAHIDDAIYIEAHDTYYASGDDDVCYAEDTGRHELTEDCWLCEESSVWYTNDIDYVEVDGCTYHPDNAPAQADE